MNSQPQTLRNSRPRPPHGNEAGGRSRKSVVIHPTAVPDLSCGNAVRILCFGSILTDRDTVSGHDRLIIRAFGCQIIKGYLPFRRDACPRLQLVAMLPTTANSGLCKSVKSSVSADPVSCSSVRQSQKS